MDKKRVPLIQAEKTRRKDVILDPKGFFVIEVHSHEIIVEYYHNVMKNNRIVSGAIQKVFTGKKADALGDTIARFIPDLLPSHYLYLGRELMRAQQALEQGDSYEQGGC